MQGHAAVTKRHKASVASRIHSFIALSLIPTRAAQVGGVALFHKVLQSTSLLLVTPSFPGLSAPACLKLCRITSKCQLMERERKFGRNALWVHAVHKPSSYVPPERTSSRGHTACHRKWGTTGWLDTRLPESLQQWKKRGMGFVANWQPTIGHATILLPPTYAYPTL